MDAFALIVFGSLAAFVLVLLALGRWSPRRASDITDKDVHDRWGAQAAIEERDVGEMVEGQNVYRRRHHRPELTEEEARRRVGAQEMERLDRADADAKSKEG